MLEQRVQPVNPPVQGVPVGAKPGTPAGTGQTNAPNTSVQVPEPAPTTGVPPGQSGYGGANRAPITGDFSAVQGRIDLQKAYDSQDPYNPNSDFASIAVLTGKQVDEMRVTAKSNLDAYVIKANTDADVARKRVEDHSVIPAYKVSIAENERKIKERADEMTNLLAALNVLPPEEIDSPLSNSESLAAAIGMAFGGSADRVLNSIQGINKERDERTFRNALRTHQAQQIHLDRKLNIAMSDFQFYRGAREQDKAGLRQAVLHEAEQFNAIDADTRREIRAAEHEYKGILLGFNEKEFASMTWAITKQIEQNIAQQARKDNMVDDSKKVLIDAGQKTLEKVTDPKAARAIVTAIGKLGGFTPPPEMYALAGSVASTNKSIQNFEERLKNIQFADNFFGDGSLMGEMRKNPPVFGPQEAPGGRWPERLSFKDFSDMMGIKDEKGRGIYAPQPEADGREEFDKLQIDIDELNSLEDENKSAPFIPGSAEANRLKKLKSEIPIRKRTALTDLQTSDSQWWATRKGALSSMLWDLKDMKDKGATKAEIDQKRSEYKRFYEHRWVGFWDEPNDFPESFRRSSLYSAGTEQFWNDHALGKDGKFSPVKVLAALREIARSRGTMVKPSMEKDGLTEQEAFSESERIFRLPENRHREVESARSQQDRVNKANSTSSVVNQYPKDK